MEAYYYPLYPLNTQLQIWEVSFQKRFKKLSTNQKFDYSEGHNFKCKNCSYPLMQGIFQIRSIHWKQNLRFERVVFQKTNKNQNISQTTEFFEGCKQSSRVKGN